MVSSTGHPNHLGMAGLTTVPKDDLEVTEMVRQHKAQQAKLNKLKQEQEHKRAQERRQAEAAVIEAEKKAKYKKDRIEQQKELQRVRDSKREGRRLRGEVWEAINAVVEAEVAKKAKEERRRAKRDRDEAAKAAVVEAAAQEVRELEAKEKAREELHQLWAEHKAYFDRQCEELARRREQKKKHERMERIKKKKEDARAAKVSCACMGYCAYRVRLVCGAGQGGGAAAAHGHQPADDARSL